MFDVKRSFIGTLAAVGVLAAGWSFAATPKAKTAAKSGGDEVAILETSKGRMVLEFWDKDAPQTVANFKTLARKGFYNGTGFHRIMKNFMVQGGDPLSKNPKAANLGTGDPGYKIKDEFNSHKHVKGVISMANSGTPNSAGSQFFIVHGNATFLDGKYTAFGRVTQGMDILDAIANTPVGPNPVMAGEPSKPLEWVTLKSVRIVPRSQVASGGGAVKAGAMTGAGVDMKAAMGKPAATSKPAAKATAPEKANAPATSTTTPAADNAGDVAKDATSGAPGDSNVTK